MSDRLLAEALANRRFALSVAKTEHMGEKGKWNSRQALAKNKNKNWLRTHKQPNNEVIGNAIYYMASDCINRATTPDTCVVTKAVRIMQQPWDNAEFETFGAEMNPFYAPAVKWKSWIFSWHNQSRRTIICRMHCREINRFLNAPFA